MGNTMFLLTVCLLWFGNPSSCSSFIFTIPGFADLHVGFTATPSSSLLHQALQ